MGGGRSSFMTSRSRKALQVCVACAAVAARQVSARRIWQPQERGEPVAMVEGGSVGRVEVVSGVGE